MQASERARYHLITYGQAAFYVLRANVDPGQEPHWLCGPCFDVQRKSVVAILDEPGGLRMECPHCGTAPTS